MTATIWSWMVAVVDGERMPKVALSLVGVLIGGLLVAWRVSGDGSFAQLASFLGLICLISYGTEWMAREQKEHSSYETYLLCSECPDTPIPVGRSYWSADDKPLCSDCYHETDRSVA